MKRQTKKKIKNLYRDFKNASAVLILICWFVFYTIAIIVFASRLPQF